MKKAIALFLSMLTICACAVSCAQPENEPADVNPAGDGTTAAEATTEIETTVEHDDLGEYNFEGAEFKMLTPGPDSLTWSNPVIDATELNGEVLNDAIYTRSRAVEARLNVKITEEYGAWDMGVATLQPLVSSNDTTYSIVTMYDRFALSALAAGLIHSYTDIPNIDITKSYWGSTMLDYSTIGGKNHFAFGDFSLYTYDNTSALLFNKSIINDYSLEDPYELVKSGKWTLDKFSEQCSAVLYDVDGDSVMTAADRWGYISMPKQVLPSMWIAAGTLSVAKDTNDIPVLNITDERFVNVFTKIFEITRDKGIWYENSIQADTDVTLETMFAANLGLYHDSTFNKIMRLREMDTDFGILPYPKYDDTQSNYYTRVSGALFSVVPVVFTDLNMTGVVLEAMASESKKTVIPVYYDISLKYKYIRDESSVEMLDIIFGNRVFDLGDSFWCDNIRDGFIKTMFTSNDRDIASAAAKQSKSISKIMAKSIDIITGVS